MIAVAEEDYTAIITSPCGMLGILDNGKSVQAINFLYDKAGKRSPRTPLAKQTAIQLQHFFDDASFCFDLPVTHAISPFQLSVRKAMLTIPVGETRSYGSVAKQLSSCARAVAGACRRNPVPIIVPCHRIVAANGIGGFSGALDGSPLETKQWLLEYERDNRA